MICACGVQSIPMAINLFISNGEPSIDELVLPDTENSASKMAIFMQKGVDLNSHGIGVIVLELVQIFSVQTLISFTNKRHQSAR